MQMVPLMARHLVHWSDEMMALQKVMQMALPMVQSLEYSLARSMEMQTAPLMVRNLAHLSDEMMASKKVMQMAFPMAKSLEHLLDKTMETLMA